MSEKPAIIKRWHGCLDLLTLHTSNPVRYPHLLASTSQRTPNPTGQISTDRYDILLAFPQARLELWPDGLRTDGLETSANRFLAALDQCWQAAVEHKGSTDTELPFTGGWFLYLGYELAAEVEPRLNLPVDNESAIPIAAAVRIPLAVIYDRQEQTSWLVCEHEYEALLAELLHDIEQLEPQSLPADVQQVSLQEASPQTFIEGVARVKDYIHEGDVFQVNLSRCWMGQNKQSISPQTLFRRLSKSNPAPYAGLACFGEAAAIVCSSPERLVRVKQGRVETRPIAGTRPRGKDSESDKQNLQELIGHPKERAEHVMLIDLERNDLGRVCRPGTVEVNELMALESYAHVHHIVSNIRGELKPDCTPGEVIRAVFPGGTITGCPKVRCMEIIAELEQAARGPYTGAMGYLNHNGDMDLNILIRSIVIDNGKVSFRAGAGLVADSIAEQELEETRAKAKGMLLSLQGEVS